MDIIGVIASKTSYSLVKPIVMEELGRRFESCRPDQSETGFPACLF